MAIAERLLLWSAGTDRVSLCLECVAPATIAVWLHTDRTHKRLRIISLSKWGNLDLNQGPTGYESAALTTELLPQDVLIQGACHAP